MSAPWPASIPASSVKVGYALLAKQMDNKTLQAARMGLRDAAERYVNEDSRAVLMATIALDLEAGERGLV